MMQYPLKSSICGLSLRTGSVIVAYLSIIKGIFMIGEGIWLIRSFDKLRRQMNDDPRDVVLHGRVCCDEWILDVSGCVCICLGALFCISSSILLLGLKKREPPLVVQWCACSALALLVSVGMCVAAAVAASSSSSSSEDPQSVFAEVPARRSMVLLVPALTGLLSAGFDVYCMMIVHSFYRQLLDEK